MKQFKYLIICLFVVTLLQSCNKDKWLEETPLDFYTTDNSYITDANFISASARLYFDVQNTFYNLDNDFGRALYYPSDIAYDAISADNHELANYITGLIPTSSQTAGLWSNLYKIIFDANVIIHRIDGSGVQITDQARKNMFKAEARFFRAYAYRTLAIVYGGVPIQTEELTALKRNYVRSTKDSVLALCISDLTYATQNLTEVTAVAQPGRVSKAAAWHLLAEVNISAKKWADAVAAAGNVINNTNFSLMTTRFGSKATEPGDAYSDLFKRNNQNRTSGNREGIWVSQYDYVVGIPTSLRFSFALPRFAVPQYKNLSGRDGKLLFTGPNAQYGGRGIGWYSYTSYITTNVWDDPADLRNSSYNVIRDIKANNPSSAYYNQYIVASNAFNPASDPINRNWSLIFAKAANINDFPKESYVGGVINPSGLLIDDFTSGREIYTDNYIFRLAETYLLRAEAYMNNSQGDLAAADINKVRSRVNAGPIAAASVNLDFILDERARELLWEEPRVLTLMRVGKFVERVKRYNPVAGPKIADYQNLWPIPQRDIETNAEAVLTQNTGY